MPFAALPSSPGFQAPQAPDWSPFALEAIRAIENRPIANTAQYVNDAVQQIDHILELSSPQARLQRQLQLEQMGAMLDTYKDYRAHPEKYQMTAHGPMLRDPYELALKRSMIRKNVATANQLDRQGNPIPLISEIDSIAKRANIRKVDSLPPTQGTVVGSAQPSTSDQSSDQSQPDSSDDALEASMSSTDTTGDQ